MAVGQNNRERRKAKARAAEARQKGKQSAAIETSQHNLSKFQRRYVSEWAVNAESMECDGHYQWMAAQVADFPTILEVGTGDGRSTLALLRAGHSVTSVEENPFCLEATELRLREAGMPYAIVRRAQIAIPAAHLPYSVRYSPLSLPQPSAGAALLIESDIANDRELEQWLQSGEKFDAMVCWLLGTHGAQQRNAFYVKEQIATASDYRLLIQNIIYERAEKVLRPGGILHLVDRGLVAKGGPQREADLLESRLCHQDQASVTDLTVGVPESRPYNEPTSEDAMPMIYKLSPKDLELLDSKRRELISIKATKP